MYSQVLSTLPSTAVSPGISSWKWEVSPSDVTYHALFPQSWHIYESPDSLPGLRIVINQISPFIPHNYAESSLPTTIFEVEVTNSSADEEDVEVSVMFTFANDIGADNDLPYELTHCPCNHTVTAELKAAALKYRRTRMSSAGVARTKRKVVVIGTVQIALADCGGQGILLVVSSS